MPAGENIEDSALRLEAMPVEIIIDILRDVDIGAIDAISKTSKRLRKIVEANWSVILRPVIDREMTPVRSFVQVLDVFHSRPPGTHTNPAIAGNSIPSFDEGSTSGEELVVFEDDGGSSDGILDSDDEEDDDGEDTDSEGDENDNIASIDDILALESSVSETVKDLSDEYLTDRWALGLSYNMVMKVCRLVKVWEQEFHRLRFAYPHLRRTLREHELRRLRHSLFVWWMYTCHFHDGPRGGDQDINSPVVRMEFVRQYSTSQLHEVRDMWETVKSAVGREICPSVPAVRRQSGHILSWAEASRVGWGDIVENNQVLGTIMKLRPEDILHLLVNRHRFATKASIIQFARFKNPWIEDSIETFSDSIQWALWERERQLVAEFGARALHKRWYFPQFDYFPRPWGGIVDYKRAETEHLRDVYSRDNGVGATFWIDDHGGPRRYLARQVSPGRLVVSRSW
ncbi:hypothetical protein OQA88_12175 [Cercophora sp. LCS_1]